MSKLTEAARGQDCKLQIFPYCNGDPATTVPCHINSEDKGIGNKSPDWWLVDGCSTCHDIIDGRKQTALTAYDIECCIMRALYRTLKNRIERGLIEIK